MSAILSINVQVVIPSVTSESKWLHCFGQEHSDIDPTWTTIKIVLKHNLVLTPSLTPENESLSVMSASLQLHGQ